MVDERKDNILKVQMFGRFAVTGLGGALDEEMLRSGMLTRFMAYLLCYRTKAISSQELMEVLWGEAESDNPAGALKNLVYRLRTLLKRIWGDQEFILTGRGTYRWNEHIPVVLDTEEFEWYCKEARAAKKPEDRICLYTKALQLYKGLFLPNLSGEYWTISIAAYFHSMYLSAVKELAKLLNDAGRYEEMSRVFSLALKLEPLDEELYCLSIRALICQKKLNLAREQYRKAVDMLYENLGVAPSQELRGVYEELLKQTHQEEHDIVAIKEEMDEVGKGGAFLCEYGVFKKLYQLEKRRTERIGISEYLALVTISSLRERKEDSKEYLDMITEAMAGLQEILLRSLRLGDVVTRYSGTQFLILLPTCQYETAKQVMQRIENSFLNGNKKRVGFRFSLEEMGFFDIEDE